MAIYLTAHRPAGVGGPFSSGASGMGGATFSGIITYLLRRIRRIRVYSGFVFSFSRGGFAPSVLLRRWLFVRWFCFSIINQHFRILRKYGKFGVPCLLCSKSVPRLPGGEIARRPSVPRFGASKLLPL